MEIPVVVSVFLLSLLAPGVLYTINNVPAIQNALPLLGLGAAVLGSVQLLMFLSVRRKKNVDPLYYVFAEFCFTCVVGLTNALEQDGFISGFMTFYVKKGEPHLSTAYAVMMCYWEGVVHFLLLLTMIHRMFRGKSYRNLGLLWVGSSIAHQIIFVPGVVIGKYGSNIHPAFWRNAPFLLLPIWAAFLLFNRPRDLSIIPDADRPALEGPPPEPGVPVRPRSAGSALPRTPSLLHEAGAQGTKQQGEEEELATLLLWFLSVRVCVKHLSVSISAVTHPRTVGPR